MKRNKDTSNLIFSAFLVTAFVICSYFFSILINDSSTLTDSSKLLFNSAVFTVFGLVLFYATRVGDGKQVKRFSLSTLIIMVLPALYIIIAGIAPNLPFSEQIHIHTEIVSLAAVSFGYGIPYTFLSGYELDNKYTEDKTQEEISTVEPENIVDNQENDNASEEDSFDAISEIISDNDSEENEY